MNANEKFMLEADRFHNAVKVGSITLVCHYYNEEKGMYPHGNCFSLYTDEGAEYRIVNFGYENLELLLHMKIIEYPIRIFSISERIAIIQDKRIPDRFYWDQFCTTCCPHNLLPLPQRALTDLHIQRGALSYTQHDDGMIISSYKTGQGNEIHMNGEDYRDVKPKYLSFGTWEELQENNKKRKAHYLSKFTKAEKQLRRKMR